MESIWKNTAELPSFPSLKEDVKTDVLIIGGGITGILTAYFLKEVGVNYLLVEKDKICTHTTGNTTAKITFQHGLIYKKLLYKMGSDTAKAYLKANRLAFSKYEELAKKINCDYERKDNYVYSLKNRKKIENEVNALMQIGYDAELCDRCELPIKIAGAVKFKDQACFNPLKFIAAIANDLNIYEHTPVTEMVGTTALTPFGKIRAQRVIVATHFPFINKHGSYFLKLYQHRSYVLALDNAAQMNSMYVDEDDTGLSFRNYKGLLLLGGGGHRTGKPGGNYNELQRFARLHYPDAEIKSYWATQDCMSLDNMPYIGRYSAQTPDMYVASGFNKWGMTGAMLAAILLTNIINGKEDDLVKVFSPSRSILKPQLFINGLESTKNLLTFNKKRCPHLGCSLKWNAAEHSWDCPCHGSRFSEKGKLLDGPATDDLKNF